jgi:hypothetical protein
LRTLYRTGRNKATPADLLWLDRTAVMRRAGMEPDPWQAQVLRSSARQLLLLASRQAGKSTVVAALALLTAVLEAPAEVLILSRTQRQSSELFRKTKSLYRTLGGRRPGRAGQRVPVPVRDLEQAEVLGSVVAERETALQLELANGSRLVSLPGNPDSLVGFSNIALLVIDEAARASDALYYAVRPMLARSKGRLVLLSTPYGRRGFFYEEWSNGKDWERVRITAPECAWLDPEFLRREEQSLGQRWYRQEYLCSFEEAAGSLFDAADIAAAVSRIDFPMVELAGD